MSDELKKVLEIKEGEVADKRFNDATVVFYVKKNGKGQVVKNRMGQRGEIDKKTVKVLRKLA